MGKASAVMSAPRVASAPKSPVPRQTSAARAAATQAIADKRKALTVWPLPPSASDLNNCSKNANQRP
jgi:hypothetical protein